MHSDRGTCVKHIPELLTDSGTAGSWTHNLCIVSPMTYYTANHKIDYFICAITVAYDDQF